MDNREPTKEEIEKQLRYIDDIRSNRLKRYEVADANAWTMAMNTLNQLADLVIALEARVTALEQDQVKGFDMTIERSLES